MATNPFRETEKAIETGRLGVWLLRNADPRTDPNANVHRLRGQAGSDRSGAAGVVGAVAANDPDAAGTSPAKFARRLWKMRNRAALPDPGGGQGSVIIPRRPRQSGAAPERNERLARAAVLALFAVMAMLGVVIVVASLAPEPPILAALPGPSAATPATFRPDATPPASPAPPAAVEPPSPPAAEAAPRASIEAAEVPAAPAPIAPGPALRPAAPDLPPSAPQRSAETAASKLTTADIQALAARGDERLRAGDVAVARPLLERAALAGDATAALRLGQSYDQTFLAGARLRGVAGNPGLAIFWYRRGQELGNDTAGFLARRLEIAARAQWSGAASSRTGGRPAERSWQP